MLEPSAIPTDTNSTATLWLDFADKIIKALALAVGAAWTWMNYKRSRTYAQKLELQLSGSVFRKDNLYLEISAGLKNLGASKYPVQQEGTGCEIMAVMKDLSTVPIKLFSVFKLHNSIEPGESISDSLQCIVALPPEDIVWLKANLRVISDKVEWNSSCLIKVE